MLFGGKFLLLLTVMSATLIVVRRQRRGWLFPGTRSFSPQDSRLHFHRANLMTHPSSSSDLQDHI
jgi:hypothetical protein